MTIVKVDPIREFAAMQDRMNRLFGNVYLRDEDTAFRGAWTPAVDIFDREAVFIERVLTGIVRDFPALKIVFEHITTSDAADFVAGSGPRRAGPGGRRRCRRPCRWR